jgi:50S ribosomal protein L16 3-hydroxylase
MLYLPPHVAHDGIALDNGCQTWSIGFRSPSYRELLQEGLWRLAESLEDLPELAKRFSDPQQAATPKPDEMPELLMEQLRDKLHSLHLAKVETFLPGIAAYLSEPKVQAIFSSPKHIFSPAKCNQQLQQTSLRPHPQSRLIRLGEHIFCNGENMTQGQSASIRKAWKTLSAQKYLGPSNSMSSIKDSSLYTAYFDGWLIFEPASER